MRRTTRWIVGGALAVAMLGSGTAVAVATGTGDDQPLSGATLDRAVAAALAETGGGTVTQTEAGDDGAAYSVEIHLADGRQVEVHLNRAFGVIGQEADDDSPTDQDRPTDR